MKKLKTILQYDHLYIVMFLMILSFIFLKTKNLFILILVLTLGFILFKKHKKYLLIYILILFLVLTNLGINNFFYQKAKRIIINNNYSFNHICHVDNVIYKKNYQKIILKYQGFYYQTFLFDEQINKKIIPGSIVKVNGKVELPKENELEYSFNYLEYCYFEKTVGSINDVYIKHIKNNFSLKILNFYLSRYYENKFNYLDNIYLRALVIGDKSVLPDFTKDNISKIGISHLFVVSGLHVSIIILIISKLCSLLKISENKSSIILIIFLTIYVIITNFLISVIRVFLGQILKFSCKNIQINSFNKFSINVLLVMILMPLKVFTLGFILSYLISGTLIMSKDILQNKNKFLAPIYISIISTLITMPLVVNLVGSVNILSVIYNIFYIPFVTFIVLPFSIIVSFLPFLEPIYHFVIIFFDKLIKLNSSYNFGNIIFPYLKITYMIIYYFLLYFVLKYLEQGILKKKLKLLSLFMLFLFCWSNIRIFNFNKSVSFINVAKGDCCLISLPHNTCNILVDTGMEDEIIPYLKKQGIKKLDYLVISHGDKDHMGQMINIIKNFHVKKVMISKYDYTSLKLLNKYHYNKIEIISKMGMYQLKNIPIKMLSPEYDHLNKNDNSLVFIMYLDNFKILFTGDASINVEKELLKKYNIDVDVYKLGHHGSNTSSCKEFIEGIKFRFGVAVNGYNNTFGFPHKEVIDNFKGHILLNTKEYKTITFYKNFKTKDFVLFFKK